jgi:hypothetical protein
MIAAMYGWYQLMPEMKAGEAYTIPAAIDIAKPRPVQKFADKPVEAKLVPSLVIVGWSESLSLLSNDFPTIILHNNLFK